MSDAEFSTFRKSATAEELEDMLVGFLMTYKKCRTDEERREVRELVLSCEERIADLRMEPAAKKEAPQQQCPPQ
jgi:hypothetical protein